MAILQDDEPSDEHTPLKKDVEMNATTSSAAGAQAPPPYTPIQIQTPSPNPIPTPSPNPIPPSSQAIPPHTDPSLQSHLALVLNRQPAIGRFLRAFVVAWLVVLLWSALMHSFSKSKHRHLDSYEYEVVRFTFHPFLVTCELIDSWTYIRKLLVDGNSKKGLTIQVAFYQSNTLPSSFPRQRYRLSFSLLRVYTYQPFIFLYHSPTPFQMCLVEVFSIESDVTISCYVQAFLNSNFLPPPWPKSAIFSTIWSFTMTNCTLIFFYI